MPMMNEFDPYVPCAWCGTSYHQRDIGAHWCEKKRAFLPWEYEAFLGESRLQGQSQIAALTAERDKLRAELELVKCGEPNHPDRAYAMKGWLKTFGFQVYTMLKHGEVGYVLSLLQSGDISRSKAAEAIAELLVGNEPPLPRLIDDLFGEDDLPREAVNQLRTALRETREALFAVKEMATTAAVCEVEAATSLEPGSDVFGASGIAKKSYVARAKGAWKVMDDHIQAVLTKHAALVEEAKETQ